jgi:hypothetical protein
MPALISVAWARGPSGVARSDCTSYRTRGERRLRRRLALHAGALPIGWHVRSYLNCGCAKPSVATPASGRKRTLLQTRNCDVLDGHIIVRSIAE